MASFPWPGLGPNTRPYAMAQQILLLLHSWHRGRHPSLVQIALQPTALHSNLRKVCFLHPTCVEGNRICSTTLLPLLHLAGWAEGCGGARVDGFIALSRVLRRERLYWKINWLDKPRRACHLCCWQWNAWPLIDLSRRRNLAFLLHFRIDAEKLLSVHHLDFFGLVHASTSNISSLELRKEFWPSSGRQAFSLFQFHIWIKLSNVQWNFYRFLRI